MATGTERANPQSYELEVLTIVNNEGEGFDIRDLMIECSIFESINRNFLIESVGKFNLLSVSTAYKSASFS